MHVSSYFIAFPCGHSFVIPRPKLFVLKVDPVLFYFNMAHSLLVIAFVSLIGLSLATYGLDVSSPYGESTMRCLHQSGYDFAVVRVCFFWIQVQLILNQAYRSNGSPDPNAPGTVAAAWAGGMAHVDVYMYAYYDFKLQVSLSFLWKR